MYNTIRLKGQQIYPRIAHHRSSCSGLFTQRSNADSRILHRKYSRYPNYPEVQYQLVDSYHGNTFFDKFYNFNGYDPEIGFALYTDREGSNDLNLTYASEKSAVLRVLDHDDNAAGGMGRYSVRVQSNAQYNEGLFIFDVIHTPVGCGIW